MSIEIYKNLNFQHVLAVIIDIIVIYFFIYRVFILLSRTRALQLMQGIFLILIADIISNYFNLTTTAWLLKNVSTYLVFVLIVILQPEMRNLLTMMGKVSFFDWWTNKTEVPISEITKAVQNMAAKKIGSTVVLLRNVRPQNIIEKGIVVNSKISSELIETIFWKDSPLHDGALLVDGKRILAASCFLPLSDSRQVDKSFGARHRSALGMAEESDAVIIVTSEETGHITILCQGEIKKINPKELGETVTNLFYAK